MPGVPTQVFCDPVLAYTWENMRRDNKRKCTRRRKKLPAENKVECAKNNTGSTVDDPACATAPMQKKLPAENKVVCAENNTGSIVDDPACATAPMSAPTVMTPLHDTPAVCNIEKVHLESDGDNEDEDDPAVLDKIVQCGQNVYDKVEFVLEEGTGPALKFADKCGGVVMIPIKMLDLDDEQNEMNDDSARKYMKAYKSVEYMRVDGLPGLTLHRGPCRFWTAIVVAPNVVRTNPD